MTTYLAITTTGGGRGSWYVVADGPNASTVEALAHERIGHPSRDITADTETRNLRVVSRTVACRQYGIKDHDWQKYLDWRDSLDDWTS